MLRLVIAFVLIAHGIGHILGFMASWTTVPSGLTTGHWIFSNDVTMSSAVGRAFGILWLLAMVGSVGAGVGLLFHQAWWPMMAAASAVLSLVAIVPWLGVMPLGSALGAVLVDIAVLVGLLFPWSKDIVEVLK
jgi:hypothetical protein